MTELNLSLRRLPSVDAVLLQDDVQALLRVHPRPLVLEGIRRVLQGRRSALQSGAASGQGPREHITATEVQAAIDLWMAPRLTPVINATGVVLHTNLGRAPLAPTVARRVAAIAGGYCNLELDLETGQRGHRMELVEELLLERTGAEAALVVNNNAAAVFLAVRVLAEGREVLVSRGEQVEIGGSFRIPDVVRASGARVVEVGCTNKTHLADYQTALGPASGLILVVHRSNFAMLGFTEDVPLDALVELAHSHSLPLLLDLGSAALVPQPPREWGDVPVVPDLLARGVDLVCFSGDKLLGGPQCGLLLGRRALVDRLARDPMARALRVGRLTLAALEETLRLYRGGEAGIREIPVAHMLLVGADELRDRANALLKLLQAGQAHLSASRVDSDGQVGGGSMPWLTLKGYGVAVRPHLGSVQDLAERLRRGRPAVLGRVQQDRLVLDVRTVLGPEQLQQLAEAVCRCAAAPAGA